MDLEQYFLTDAKIKITWNEETHEQKVNKHRKVD